MRFKILKQGGYNGGGISATGGSMTGPLVLSGNPSSPLQAATKGYVDSGLSSLNAASLVTGLIPVERLPAFTGELTNVAGTNVFSLTNTGITPGTYPKVTVNAKGRITNGYLLSEADLPALDWNKITAGKPTTMAGYGITDAVAPAGGTMTGSLLLNNLPTAPLHVATKAYIDALATANAAGLAAGDVVRKVTNVTPAGFLRANGGVVSQSTYSALYAVLKDTFATKTTLDYTSYLAMGAGNPSREQYDFKTPDISTLPAFTTNTGTLVTGGAGFGHTVATKTRLYVIGAANASNTATPTQYAPINADGTLGAWVTATESPMAVPSWNNACFMTKNRVYVIGGDGNGNTSLLCVQYAPINADGSLGTWVQLANFPFQCNAAKAIVTKSRVYIINNGYNQHFYATINTDGSLGAWTAWTATDIPNGNGKVFTTRNRVYHILPGTLSTAVIDSTGAIGAWSVIASGFTPSFYDFAPVVTKNRVWLLAGNNGTNPATAVYTAPIAADGTVGAFTTTTTLPVAVHKGMAALVKDHLYVLGGYPASGASTAVYSSLLTGNNGLTNFSMFYDGTINKFDGSDLTGDFVVQNDYPDGDYTMPGNGKPWAYQSQINAVQSSTTLSFSPVSTGVSYYCAAAFVTKNYVYIYAGWSGTVSAGDQGPTNASWRAPINADGTLGTFISVNAPASVAWSTSLVTKNRAWLLGGTQFGNNAVQTIWTAPIDATGVIGAWTVHSNPLPIGVTRAYAFITKDRVYMVTGTATYYAPIDASGMLGVWVNANLTLPYSADAYPIVTRNRVYIPCNTKICVAPINADGSLGVWSDSSLTSVNLSDARLVVMQNRVYWFSPTNTQANIYTATVATDGTLGTPTLSTSTFSTPSNSSPVVVTKGYIHAFGGFSSSLNSYVSGYYSAPISGGMNDYSAYYDGTITAVATGNFRLPDYSTKEMPGSYTYIKY